MLGIKKISGPALGLVVQFRGNSKILGNLQLQEKRLGVIIPMMPSASSRESEAGR